MKRPWRVKSDEKTDTLLERILKLRGHTDPEETKVFLEPKYENLLDPFLFPDMAKSVERIWSAIENKEPIAVYADYDADAVTAAAVVLRGLEYLGVPTDFYIPDRFQEGYGLNIEAFEKIKQKGAKVVITVDCGTNSCDVADWCKSQQIDLIITDHHEVIGDLPQSFSLINPKNPQEPYPDKQLTGAGVAYKLAQGLFADHDRVSKRREEQGQAHAKGWEKWLLDAASIGTVADCHTLLGENRIIVKYGLEVLGKTKWPGIRALLEGLKLGSERKLDARSIGFQIAPRINAAGRLEHAGIALKLFLENDPSESSLLANMLEKINLRRQGITERIISEATEQAIIQTDREILVLAGDDWHLGVVGVVAGRMAEQFSKPTIVLGGSGEHLFTGSARSRSGFNTVHALEYSAQHLVKFGGHAGAAGLTLEKAKLSEFTSSVLEYHRLNKTEEKEPDTLELDTELFEEDLNLKEIESLEKLEPLGMGNPEPKFLLKNAEVININLLGKEQQHTKFMFKIGTTTVEGISFSRAKEFAWIKVGHIVDVACTASINEWRNRKTISLKIIDIKNASS